MKGAADRSPAAVEPDAIRTIGMMRFRGMVDDLDAVGAGMLRRTVPRDHRRERHNRQNLRIEPPLRSRLSHSMAGQAAQQVAQMSLCTTKGSGPCAQLRR